MRSQHPSPGRDVPGRRLAQIAGLGLTLLLAAACGNTNRAGTSNDQADQGGGEIVGRIDGGGETLDQGERSDARTAPPTPDARVLPADAHMTPTDGGTPPTDAHGGKDATARLDGAPFPDATAPDAAARDATAPDAALRPDARIQLPDIGPTNDHECDVDTDCLSDERCDQNFCVIGCRDNECGADEICNAGRCELAVCAGDADCPEASFCAGDLCIPGCRHDPDNCPAGQVCNQLNICDIRLDCLPAEICGNGVDDNCDGRIDEEAVCGLPCQPGRDCPTGEPGLCGTGSTVCLGPLANVLQCTVTVLPAAERCNGQDDDCDGQVDEDFPQVGRPCTAGAGFCVSLGTWICTAEGDVRCDAVRGLGRTELCDGQDDDCDGATDENFPELGAACASGVGACARNGIRVCGAAGDRTVCDAAPGAPGTEVCDNLDNDCNGRIDDNIAPDPCYDGPDGTMGVGRCATGGRRCVAGGLASCEGEILPAAEICNGLDDDCDGFVDEDDAGLPLARSCFTGAPGLAGIGACRPGTQTCSLGHFGACVGEVLPGLEICDGQDNDCNGAADDGANGCNCQPGASRACYTGPAGTSGVGLCRDGRQTCDAGGHYGACLNQRTPAVETCDGLDNNCDARVDNLDNVLNGVGVACTAGRGVCARDGLTVCDAAVGGVVCNAVAAAPAAETCDGVDNNCDGRIDEGFRLGLPCAAGSGACQRAGVYVCRNGGSVCSAQAAVPVAEICDGLDNDCDGVADNGLNVGTPCQAGVGACLAGGRIVCESGAAVCNARALPPQPEVCDHFDNNCNGQDDEDFPLGQACHVGQGACGRDGVIECAADGGTQCSAVAGNGHAELCNGLDDDCDGQIDEGDPGGGVGCDAGGRGVCATARTHCRAGQVVCESDQRPSPEVCDGLDNNCDGATDEGLGQTTCGLGPCTHTVDNCVQGRVQQCQPLAGATNERCDGQDNNCDGVVDNNPVDVGGDCFVGTGVCQRGAQRTCRNGALTCPAVAGQPTPESCNGLDDNCDGIADEGRTCPDNIPPTVEIRLDTNIGEVGQAVGVTVSAVDNHSVARMTLLADGLAVALDASGQGVYLPAAPGTVTFLASAWDGWDNRGDATVQLRVADPNDNQPPYVRITAPADQEIATGLISISGTLRDPNFLDWTMETSTDGVTWTPLATGNAPAEDQVLAQLDPTLVLPGYLFVKLTGEDLGGLQSFHVVALRVPEGISVGETKLQYRDLDLPLKGFHITVDRGYDSRDHRMGDFGYGWRLMHQDVGLHEDIYGNVAVELPDGRHEVFALGYDLNPILHMGTVFYTAPLGISSKLEAMDDCLAVVSGAVVYCFLTPGRPPDIINRYRLTTAEGTIHEIDQAFGTRLVRDRAGNTLTFTENGVTSSTGVAVTYGRDALGRISSITDPSGAVVRYAYDAFGHLDSVTDATQAVTRYTYDAGHRLVDVVLPDGTRAMRTEYDASGRRVRALDALGRAIVWQHDLPGRTETVTDRRGHQTVYTYDAQGNVTQVRNHQGGTHTTTYDAGGRRLTEADELGATTTYGYTAQGLVDQVTDPEGRTRRATYDALAHTTALTDATGATLHATFDANGRQDTVTNAVGGTERYTFDADGNRDTRTTAAGEVHHYVYDDGGNITEATLPGGRTLRYILDANGRLTDRQEDNQPPAHLDYDAMGRLLAFTLPTGEAVSIDRDPLGRPQAFHDGLGNVTRYTYGPTGPLATVVDPAGQTTRYDYDPNGNLTRVTAADGSTTDFGWDVLDRPLTRPVPGGGTYTYGYDAAGHLTSLTDATGAITRFEYDRSGLASGRIEPDGTHITQERDGAGRIVAIDAPTGGIVANYDGDGRLIGESTPEGDVTAEFDPAGRLTRFSAAGQACTWSGPGRPNATSTLACAPGGAVVFTYDLHGRPAQVAYPSGATTRFTWDASGRLVALDATDAAGVVRLHRAYSLDAGGRPTRIDLGDAGSQRLTYDRLGELTSSTRLASDGGTVRTRSYAYNAVGHRTRLTTSERGAENVTYNAANRTGSDGAFDYTYDANGRVSGRTDRLSGIHETFGYDAEGHLTAALRFARNGAHLGDARYFYDPSGRRVAKTVDGLTRRYLYDGLNRVAELDDAGNILARWVYGPRLDQPLLMVRGNDVYSYVQDGRGDVIALLDAAGRIVNRYEYDDFGELLLAQEVVENPLTFAGRGRDAETGFYDLRARTYDPRTGRFLQPDPAPGRLQAPLTQNPYIYVRNSPYTSVDPLGATEAIEYGFKLAEIFGFGASAEAPDGYELIGSLIGFFQGFAGTGLVFLANILEIANNGGDLMSQWGEAISRTAAKMDEIKGLLGYTERLDNSGFVGGYINGAHFQVGIRFSAVVEPPEPVGDVMGFLGIDNPASWEREYQIERDYGGFGNGVSNALDFFRQLGPH